MSVLYQSYAGLQCAQWERRLHHCLVHVNGVYQPLPLHGDNTQNCKLCMQTVLCYIIRRARVLLALFWSL